MSRWANPSAVSWEVGMTILTHPHLQLLKQGEQLSTANNNKLFYYNRSYVLIVYSNCTSGTDAKRASSPMGVLQTGVLFIRGVNSAWAMEGGTSSVCDRAISSAVHGIRGRGGMAAGLFSLKITPFRIHKPAKTFIFSLFSRKTVALLPRPAGEIC